ncbi:HIRAN domain-containing protein [Ruania alkalisoli]|uniref:HIRAN domain-containing protein n=1 Tax=Ruania alkalisoli TaxID=2779775 RepID=A0A7M1SNJ5_9MICO|nr:HIRAN domain-containing protein [Ruania alkalisoli]QOR69129.1 HIRAN domain-containing protein [Ruania alkalisoli]
MAGFWQRLFRRDERQNPVITARVERRAPTRRSAPPPARRATVHSSEYVPREEEETLLRLDANGLPNLRLVRARDRLVLEAPGRRWVNPSSPNLRRIGITVFRVRGVSHHEAAVRTGRFTPGSPVRLVREPDNEHDPSAVAVYAEKARRPAGYVNKQNAKRLARLLDAGDELVAISTRGSAAGRDGSAPVVLVTSPEILAHLQR